MSEQPEEQPSIQPDTPVAEPELDAYRELYEIARGLRASLAWHRRNRVHYAPDAATARPEDVDWRSLDAGRAAPEPAAATQTQTQMHTHTPGAEAVRRAGEPPGREQEPPRPHLAIEEALGFSSMSEALANVLGEPSESTRQRAREREAPVKAVAERPAVSSSERPVLPSSARPTLAQVRAELGECQRCKLAPRRTHLVFGVGAETAPLMFIGEAPGEQEDLRGEPFVGPAGQLLDRMISAMGWSRAAVYIANVLKCRPPGNRDPEPDEVAACRPFLERQIAAVGPRLIVTLGRPAAHLILRTNQSMGRLRGRFHTYLGIPVMPTYHPSYLLRNPEAKRDAWEDLKQVIAELERMGVRAPYPPRG